MERADIVLDELNRQGRKAYRRLVRASTPQSGAGFCCSECLTNQIDNVKIQLRVDLKLQQTAPWAASALRTAALKSRLANLLRVQSLTGQ